MLCVYREEIAVHMLYFLYPNSKEVGTVRTSRDGSLKSNQCQACNNRRTLFGAIVDMRQQKCITPVCLLPCLVPISVIGWSRCQSSLKARRLPFDDQSVRRVLALEERAWQSSLRGLRSPCSQSCLVCYWSLFTDADA